MQNPIEQENESPKIEETITAEKELLKAQDKVNAELDEISDLVNQDRIRRQRTFRMLLLFLLISALLSAIIIAGAMKAQSDRNAAAEAEIRKNEQARQDLANQAKEIPKMVDGKLRETQTNINNQVTEQIETARNDINEFGEELDELKVEVAEQDKRGSEAEPSNIENISGSSSLPLLVETYIKKEIKEFSDRFETRNNIFITRINNDFNTFKFQFDKDFDNKFDARMNATFNSKLTADLDFQKLNLQIQLLQKEINNLKNGVTTLNPPKEEIKPQTLKPCIKSLAVKKQLQDKLATFGENKPTFSSPAPTPTPAIIQREISPPTMPDTASKYDLAELSSFPYLTYVVREGSKKPQRLYNLGIDIYLNGVKNGILQKLVVVSNGVAVYPKQSASPTKGMKTPPQENQSADIRMGETIIFEDKKFVYSLIPIFLNKRFLTKDFIGLAISRAEICPPNVD